MHLETVQGMSKPFSLTCIKISNVICWISKFIIFYEGLNIINEILKIFSKHYSKNIQKMKKNKAGACLQAHKKLRICTSITRVSNSPTLGKISTENEWVVFFIYVESPNFGEKFLYLVTLHFVKRGKNGTIREKITQYLRTLLNSSKQMLTFKCPKTALLIV